MIHLIIGLPTNMVGFRATGEVTEADFSEMIIPHVKELVDRTGKLNYLLVLETSLKNFSPGAWYKDALMGLKHLNKWHRAAIVTDEESIRGFTNSFSHFVPGEYKGFEPKDLDHAIFWVSEQAA